MVINLKDLKLNDMIKIALTATAIIALTFTVTISINNTTIINNYIEESKQQALDTQSNLTKVKSDINKTLEISQEILNEVD